MQNSNPLKILCLHGYRQTGDIFKEKTGSLRKVFKKRVEWSFVTAPNVVPPLNESDEKDGGHGWWFSREDNYFKATYKSEFVKGFEESVKIIKNVIEEKGPFDGIFGFSQGAALAAMLCLLQEKGDLEFNFKFAIIGAGFISQSSPHDDIYSAISKIPTLHIIGETDQVIDKKLSDELLKYFENPTILTHPGGHFVPASSAQKKPYLDFIEKMNLVCQKSPS